MNLLMIFSNRHAPSPLHVKTLQLAVVLSTVCLPALAPAQADFSSTARAAGIAAVQQEIDLIAAAHAAAQKDSDATVDEKLGAPVNASLKCAEGALLARRAAAVCAWLKNDRDFDRATKLGRKALQRLEHIAAETGSADRVERLYWAAWLQAETQNDKAAALKLIAEAELLSPEDLRLVWGKRNWTTRD